MRQWQPKLWTRVPTNGCNASTWIEMAQSPCWLPRGQQVLHQRWIWGICCVQTTKHTSDRMQPGFETRGRRQCHKKVCLHAMSPSPSPLPLTFNIVSIVMNTLTGRTGYTPILLIKVSFNSVKCTTLKNGDVDGTCKRHLNDRLSLSCKNR